MRATALVGLAALVSAPASATVYQFSWSGTVTSLLANTSATNVMLNDAASASFTFDDRTAVFVPMTNSAPQLMNYSGILTNYQFSVGSISLAAPIVSTMFLTETDWFGQDGFSFNPQFDPLGYSLEHAALGFVPGYTGNSLTNGFSLNGLTNQRLTLNVGVGAARESIVATMTNATVTVLGAVPEPATWGMMICGFGLVGGVLRSRRKTALGLT